ncbi:MAG: ATP-grasp domain-containing protein [Acidimicrobiaceae bacterium]|jgi:acetyl/propionyl-CoA carboxylase alpha subunit|nr:ATP-grasp domain-containing protein [Acidimicrobiaceae bacterium]
MRILIANRGEIARRIIRTAHRLGHETVAVYAEPDVDAPFVGEATMAVAIGPASLADSYLSGERILAAAAASGATAVHPGYGFLAENATFAQSCIDQDLIWIGPRPQAIASMGSKIEARAIAERAEVPTIPGWSESQDSEELAQAAAQIGFPVLVKASAGGGGKGIRIAHDPTEFANALSEASAEAQHAFGDGSVIVERYVQRPRHIEVQIVGDKHGATAELGTRECSVQRRYQKLLEEAPAPNLTPETRRAIRDSAQAIAKVMGYDSAGTVEFIVDDETGDHFFLEVNTRLQVEHPVTEAITGVDLVELMIRVAAGERLPLDPEHLRFQGHAIEVRIVAEDTSNGFAPQIGTVHQVQVPDDVRWDSAIESGSEISPHYDSMIAKLIVHGSTRDEALAKMRRALDHLIIDGVVTTAGFHRWLLDQEPVVAGRVTTRFLDETTLPQRPDDELSAALAAGAIAWAQATDDDCDHSSPWMGSSFSVTPHEMKRNLGLVDADGEVYEIALTANDLQGKQLPPVAVDQRSRRVAVNEAGHTYSFSVPNRTERWAPSAATRKSSGDALVAPFPAVVNEVTVTPGDEVEGDQVLVVIEAMKMLHSLRATGASTIAEVRVAAGDQIATGDVLVTFVNDSPSTDSQETPQ